MSKQLQWVMIAVPVANRTIAAKVYSQKTKNPADDDSFTPGFFDTHGAEWGVACWAIDKSNVAQFDELIQAHPEAKVAKWMDAVSSAEQELGKLGLSRPVAELQTPKGEPAVIKGK